MGLSLVWVMGGGDPPPWNDSLGPSLINPHLALCCHPGSLCRSQWQRHGYSGEGLQEGDSMNH